MIGAWCSLESFELAMFDVVGSAAGETNNWPSLTFFVKQEMVVSDRSELRILAVSLTATKAFVPIIHRRRLSNAKMAAFSRWRGTTWK